MRNALIVFVVVAFVASVAWWRQRTASLDGSSTTQAARLPRMIDLGSDKCIPCKEMMPILAALKKEYAGRAEIEVIDVWKDEAAAERYDARVIPTQVFFDRAGREVWRHEGFLSSEEIIQKLRELGAK